MSKNYCEHCGSLLNRDNSCPNCDKYKLKKENTLICTKCGTEIHYDEFLSAKKKKLYILKCSKCKAVLKGKKIIIARNVAIFSGLSIALILGIVNANHNFKGDTEIKVDYEEEKYSAKEEKDRVKKLESIILDFSTGYTEMYMFENYQLHNRAFSEPIEFKNTIIEEIKGLKAKNITKLLYNYTYIINDSFNAKTEIGKATINLSGFLSYNNEYEKQQFDKKIEITYDYKLNEFNTKEIQLLKYSVLEQSF